MSEKVSEGEPGAAETVAVQPQTSNVPLVVGGLAVVNDTRVVAARIRIDRPRGEVLLLDFGVTYAGYNSDITRTLPVNGHFTARQREIYEAALAIEEACRQVYRPGIEAKDVQPMVLEILKKKGIKAHLMDLSGFDDDEALTIDGRPLPRLAGRLDEPPPHAARLAVPSRDAPGLTAT